MQTKTELKVKLVGTDGNAFALIGKCVEVLKKAGFKDEVDEFLNDATAGDYNHLLTTCKRWFIVM